MAHAQAQTAPTRPAIPRWLLIGAGSLMVLSLALTFLSSLTGIKADLTVGAKVVAARAIYFTDASADEVIVTDAATGDVLWTIEQDAANPNTFVRTVFKGFQDRRALAGVTVPASYSLVRLDSGRVSLMDLETGHYVNLDAFGQDNKALLSRFVAGGPEFLGDRQ